MNHAVPSRSTADGSCNEPGGFRSVRRKECPPICDCADFSRAAMAGSDLWHPKLRRFLNHWRAIHPPKGLPSRRDFDPMRIYDLLPNVWLLDVWPGPFRLRYRLIGTRIVATIGRDATGAWLDEAHPHIARNARALERYRAVVDRHTPSWRRGPPRLWRHDDYGEVENLIVPLASDGRTVDILAVMTLLHGVDGDVY